MEVIAPLDSSPVVMFQRVALKRVEMLGTPSAVGDFSDTPAELFVPIRSVSNTVELEFSQRVLSSNYNMYPNVID